MSGGSDRNELGRYFAIGQVGLEMVVPPALGVYLDSRFGWSPWGVVVGAAAGLIVGLVHLVYLSNPRKDEGPGPSDERKAP
jgi:hypothetical protein